MMKQSPGKPLIIGANGQLGAAMVSYLDAVQGPGSSVPSGRAERPGWLRIDLESLSSVEQIASLLDHVDLSSIFCVAGYTWVDGAEDAPERAFQVNTHAPLLLAAYARGRGLPFAYFSTDYVFNGYEATPGPYSEQHSVDPKNVYGRSKADGEQQVLTEYPDALVLRTTVVYGQDRQRKNYLYQALRALAKGELLKVPQDQISTPTYNVDLARAVLTLVEQGARGIYHVAGPEAMSRLEFATEIARTFGLDCGLLQPLITSDLTQRAERPLRGGLSIRKLQEDFPALRMRGVQEALREERSYFEDLVTLWKSES